MKYSRLTKEQFEALHEEFAQFLASQSIDPQQWKTIKREQPQLVEEELDLFSDMIWEKTLNQVTHLENAAAQHLFLFACQDKSIQLRVVQCKDPQMDLTTAVGWEWVLQNLYSDKVSLLTSEKPLDDDRGQQLFKLIQEGCQIVSAERFEQLNHFFKKTKK